jgi:hypothetical protein
MYDSIVRFSRTKSNWVIAFLWGLAEGVFFFIVPDVYLGFVALFSIGGGLGAMAFSVIGSLVGAGAMFALVSLYGASLNNFLVHIPGITQTMVQKVSVGLDASGLKSLLMGPLNGIPYKIYSVNAALQHFSLSDFLLWSIPARLERILPVTIFALILGLVFRKSIKKNPKYWVIGYLATWVLIYIFYYTHLS